MFPLAEAAIPAYLTKEGAIINLLRETQFYGLGKLEERIQRIIAGKVNPIVQSQVGTTAPSSPIKRYKFMVSSEVK